MSLLAILIIVFMAGCTQTQPASTDKVDPESQQPAEEEMAEPADEVPEDYVGVWYRTGTYGPGYEGHEPATWTLNATNYTSTGTCINTGQVIYEGDNTVTVTLDSTTCPGASAGGSFTYTYEISYDEERGVETMTTYTGPVTETYDRLS